MPLPYHSADHICIIGHPEPAIFSPFCAPAVFYNPTVHTIGHVLGLEGAEEHLPRAVLPLVHARPAVSARRPRRARHGVLEQPAAAHEARLGGAREAPGLATAGPLDRVVESRQPHGGRLRGGRPRQPLPARSLRGSLRGSRSSRRDCLRLLRPGRRRCGRHHRSEPAGGHRPLARPAAGAGARAGAPGGARATPLRLPLSSAAAQLGPAASALDAGAARSSQARGRHTSATSSARARSRRTAVDRTAATGTRASSLSAIATRNAR